MKRAYWPWWSEDCSDTLILGVDLFISLEVPPRTHFGDREKSVDSKIVWNCLAAILFSLRGCSYVFQYMPFHVRMKVVDNFMNNGGDWLLPKSCVPQRRGDTSCHQPGYFHTYEADHFARAVCPRKKMRKYLKCSL